MSDGVLPPYRVALVTGAGRGIGRLLAIGLAEAGLAVGLLGRTREPLQDLAGDLVARGAQAGFATADVTSWEAVRSAVAALEADLGGVDLLVNNAGVIDDVEVPVWQSDPATWWQVVETDLRGPFHCVRAVVPGMVERGHGRVIDLNSGSGTRDSDVYSAYHVAKTGLFRLGGAVHQAGHDLGLRAFQVAPGVVVTDMTRSMAVHDDRTDWTPPEAVVSLVLAIATGRLDHWSGRFVRAGVDDLDDLAAHTPTGTARTLGLVGHGPSDPLAPGI